MVACLLISWPADLQVHIVYMGELHPELHPELVRDSHHGMLAAVLGRLETSLLLPLLTLENASKTQELCVCGLVISQQTGGRGRHPLQLQARLLRLRRRAHQRAGGAALR